MNETIRDCLTRRVRWTWGIGFACWLVLPLASVAGLRNPLIIFAAMAGFLGAMLSMLWVKCPRCSVRLGQSIAGTLAIPGLKPQPNFCPYCGVSLDERRFKQPAQAANAPYNPIR
jgi:hypothetical protein